MSEIGNKALLRFLTDELGILDPRGVPSELNTDDVKCVFIVNSPLQVFPRPGEQDVSIDFHVDVTSLAGLTGRTSIVFGFNSSAFVEMEIGFAYYLLGLDIKHVANAASPFADLDRLVTQYFMTNASGSSHINDGNIAAQFYEMDSDVDVVETTYFKGQGYANNGGGGGEPAPSRVHRWFWRTQQSGVGGMGLGYNLNMRTGAAPHGNSVWPALSTLETSLHFIKCPLKYMPIFSI